MKLTATHIDPRAATVDLPYPEAEPARLRLELPMGKIDLEPGAGDSLISGKVTYNVAELKPRYSTKGRTVRIRQQYRALIPTGKVTNEWAFLLGTAAPYSLEVSAGASAASLDLGGLPLTNLTLESGAGDLNVTFDAPNPTRLKEIKVNAGAGRSSIEGLLYANAERIKVGGGVGQTIVKFTGADFVAGGRAKIETGVGEIVLVLAEYAPIRVRTSTGLGNVRADSDLIRTGKGYETASYAGAEDVLEIEVSSGVGEIKIELA